MSDSNDHDLESLRQFLGLVRGADPFALDSDAHLEALASGSEKIEIADNVRSRVLRSARIAQEMQRQGSTLGHYVTLLRKDANLSRDALAQVSQLSPATVAEIEGDKAHLLSIQPGRLARLAVQLGAIKLAILELVAQALAVPPQRAGAFRITRLDKDATLLESERAVRKTGSSGSSQDPESYLTDLATAFDAEVERTHRA